MMVFTIGNRNTNVLRCKKMKRSKKITIAAFLLSAFFCLYAFSACQQQSEDSSAGKKPDKQEKPTGQEIQDGQQEPDGQESQNQKEENAVNNSSFYITAGDTIFTAVFADNSSAQAFKELLSKGDLTVNMSDYGSFEKVGEIGTSLPRNDEQITTEPGDVILYLGTSVTIYYDTNSWSFTRLGKIEGATKEGLLSAFGKGDVSVTFSLTMP